MTATPITTDPALYGLFERIIREAPQATEYRIEAVSTRTNGSKFKHDRRLTGAEKEQLPWGVHDAIINATWWFANDWGVAAREFVNIHADAFSHGITVVTTIHSQGPRTFGLSGIVARNPGMCLALDTEDEVVAKVMEFIQVAVDAADDPDSELDDDYDDDRSRYDPLDERNYPLHER